MCNECLRILFPSVHILSRVVDSRAALTSFLVIHIIHIHIGVSSKSNPCAPDSRIAVTFVHDLADDSAISAVSHDPIPAVLSFNNDTFKSRATTRRTNNKRQASFLVALMELLGVGGR